MTLSPTLPANIGKNCYRQHTQKTDGMEIAIIALLVYVDWGWEGVDKSNDDSKKPVLLY